LGRTTIDWIYQRQQAKIMSTETNKLVVIGVDAVTRCVEGVADLFDEVRTELHLIFAEDDYVATRLSHNVVFKQDWVTRLGSHHVIGKPVDWAANVIFKFSGDKIIEEWIERDELSMHYKLGLLAS
jgi:predicted ester cyclase